MSRRSTEGVWSVFTRGYLLGGELAMSESDDDGDGYLELLVIFDHGTNDLEVFERQRDGTTEPVSTPVLQLYR